MTGPAPWLAQPELERSPQPTTGRRVEPSVLDAGADTSDDESPEITVVAPPTKPSNQPIDTPWVQREATRTDIEVVKPPDEIVKPQLPTGIICPACQTDNEPTRRFCKSCGTPLVAPTPLVEKRRTVRGRPAWVWVVILVPVLIVAGIAGFAIAAGLKSSNILGGSSPSPSSSVPGSPAASGGSGGQVVHELAAKTIKASSQLGGRSNARWSPGKAIDGKKETSWQEGVDGSVKGQWIEVTFANPGDITSITILAGNQAGEANYKANLRPRHITLRADGGDPREFELKDEFGPQDIAFIGHVDAKLRLTIIDTYAAEKTSLEGSPFEDCAISEIQFFGTQ